VSRKGWGNKNTEIMEGINNKTKKRLCRDLLSVGEGTTMSGKKKNSGGPAATQGAKRAGGKDGTALLFDPRLEKKERNGSGGATEINERPL